MTTFIYVHSLCCLIYASERFNLKDNYIAILLTVLEYFLSQRRLMDEAPSTYNFLLDFYHETEKRGFLVPLQLLLISFTYNFAISEPMNALFCIISMGLLSRILKNWKTFKNFEFKYNVEREKTIMSAKNF